MDIDAEYLQQLGEQARAERDRRVEKFCVEHGLNSSLMLAHVDQCEAFVNDCILYGVNPKTGKPNYPQETP